ncbi:MAG: hypothetical protein K8S87_01440, partial [Planctomycetes bacterium]|nr:hypothetical protein [Planctomycetota bacterium]
VEVPVFGVYFLTDRCTKSVDIVVKDSQITLSYGILISKRDLCDLKLELYCNEYSTTANKLNEVIGLELPGDSRIYTLNYPVPKYATKLVFQLRLTPANPQDADIAYSQEFACIVFSSNNPQNQTQHDNNNILKVTLDKPLYKASREVNNLIDIAFYTIDLQFNLKIENPKFPITWSREVNYTCSKILPEYLINTLPPTKSPLECNLAHIEALPPGKIQELKQSIKLVYVEELFPLIYNHVEIVKIGDKEYKISIKFKILEEKKFPPAISVSLISEGKILCEHMLQ